MKSRFKLLIITFILTVTSFSSFAKYGCDWDIAGKSSGTVNGKKCSQMTWTDIAGNPVPNDQIICCDWDNDSYSGGINCPFGKPADPKDKTIGYAMNFYVNENIKIAVNVSTGDVEMIDFQNNIKKVLLSANVDMFGSAPTSFIIHQLNTSTVRIAYQDVSDGVGSTEIGGQPFKDFVLSTTIDALYSSNLSNIIAVYPIPVSVNGQLTLDNRLFCCHQVVVKAFDIQGNLHNTYSLNKGTNAVVHGLQANSYKLVVIMDNKNIGNIDLLVQ
jgi:hypothetical protein